MSNSNESIKDVSHIGRILKLVELLMFVLIAFFLGYISAHLTNQQIEKYCLDYNLAIAQNRGIEILENYTFEFNITSSR